MNPLSRIALVPACAALAACSASTPVQVVCPGEVRPSVLVNVVDAETSASVSLEASGTWTSGTLADSLRHVQVDGGLVMLAAFGPPGRYVVRVARPGRVDWVHAGFIVPEGACGPEAAELTATHALAG
jgi:hypothetical protein